MTDPSAPATNALWRAPPLILASKSRGRARLLDGAGIPNVAIDSGLDERSVEREAAWSTPQQLAEILAIAKATRVSQQHPGKLVLGADQVLGLGSEILHKAETQAQALAQLRAMRGREHRLHSALAIVRDGQTEFAHVSTATIALRNVSDDVLDAYSTAMGDRLLQTVCGYEIEGLGVNLIERIDGDFFTVVGLPLLPLLAFCRRVGLMIEEGRLP